MLSKGGNKYTRTLNKNTEYGGGARAPHKFSVPPPPQVGGGGVEALYFIFHHNMFTGLIDSDVLFFPESSKVFIFKMIWADHHG